MDYNTAQEKLWKKVQVLADRKDLWIPCKTSSHPFNRPMLETLAASVVSLSFGFLPLTEEMPHREHHMK